MFRKYCTITTGRTLKRTIRPLPTACPPPTLSLPIPRLNPQSSISSTITCEQPAFLARFQSAQNRFLSTINEDDVSSTDEDDFPFHVNGAMEDSFTLHPSRSENAHHRDIMPTAATFGQVDSEWKEKQHPSLIESTDAISRRQLLKESLAKEVQGNVMTIIQQIESLRVNQQQQQQQPPTETTSHPQRPSNQLGSIKKPLSKQWELALRREMQGLHRSHSQPGQLTRSSSSHQSTIDLLWDKAIQTAGIGHLEMVPNDFSQIDRPAHSSDEEENQGTESNMTFSPLFGLPVHDLGLIHDHDIPEANQVESLEETLNIDHATLEHDDNNANVVPELSRLTSLNAIHACLALLTVTSKSEWDLFQSHQKALVNVDLLPGDDNRQGEVTTGRDLALEMLEYSRVNRLLLTTEECNLLIARMLSSPTMEVDEILEKCLVFFNEMKRFSATGIEDTGPDANTYRLLFSALLRRLVATGEAAQICKTMANSSVKLNHQIVLDGMKVCQAYGDLATASKLMSKALDSYTEPSLTVQSARIYIEMLQTKNKSKEALEFYDVILKSKVLQPAHEDEVLLQLCRWPNRSRNGDTIDCTSVLVYVKRIIFEKVHQGEQPRLHLWFVLLEQLAQAERLDPSLGKYINQTFRGMLKAYPGAWPGMGLLKIGLRAAEVTRDAGLIAALLARDITTKVAKSNKRKAPEQTSNGDALLQQAPIPWMVFRKALQVAHETLDTEAASLILEHYRHVDRDYPSSAKAEVYSLVIQTYAMAAKGEMAKALLFSMIDDEIEPTEELTGIVLQSLVSSGQADDARELFDVMMAGTTQLPTPNVTSFNAILVAAINTRQWDEALSVVDVMKEKGVLPNSQTTQGRLLAYVNKFGKDSIPAFMRRLLTERTPMDQATFAMAFRILLPSLDGKDIDDMRLKARAMGEKEPQLRQASLNMIRSIRTAETLSAKSRNSQGTLPQQHSSESWMAAFSDLLEFTQQIDKIKNDSLAS